MLLKGVTRASSGTFRCEVMGDKPLFETDDKAKNMTVVGECLKEEGREGEKGRKNRDEKGEGKTKRGKRRACAEGKL